MNTNLRDVSRLIQRLEKWAEKRRAKQLECEAIDSAVHHLREYRSMLEIVSGVSPERRAS